MPDNNSGSPAQWFAAVATSAGLLYVLLKEIVWEWLTRPNIILSFDCTCKDQGNTVFRGQPYTPSPTAPDSRWVRIQARSEVFRRFLGCRIRRRYAKGCRAYLVAVRITGNSQAGMGEMQNDVRRLGWEHGEQTPEVRDLLPGIVNQIDLAYCHECPPTPEQERALFYATTPVYGGTRHGRYTFTVFVTSENAEPKGIEVILDWAAFRESLRPVSSNPVPLPSTPVLPKADAKKG
jgi:hypothetical protein